MFPKAPCGRFYVMMAFRIAWFKVHRPLAFYSAYFSVRAKGFDASCMIKGDKVCIDKIKELQMKDREKTISAAEKEMMTTLEVCHEFYRRGFVFEPMDIYTSAATDFIVTEKGLVPPFTSMPGIGEQAAQNIVEERRNGRFLSAEEMAVRCPRRPRRWSSCSTRSARSARCPRPRRSACLRNTGEDRIDMAKYEKQLTGDFDAVLSRLFDAVMNGSMSASYEDGSDWEANGMRCAVRVFERYSWAGGNRVSMTLMLTGYGNSLFLSAITSGGSYRQCFGKSTPWERKAFWKRWCRSRKSTRQGGKEGARMYWICFGESAKGCLSVARHRIAPDMPKEKIIALLDDYRAG